MCGRCRDRASLDPYVFSVQSDRSGIWVVGVTVGIFGFFEDVRPLPGIEQVSTPTFLVFSRIGLGFGW